MSEPTDYESDVGPYRQDLDNQEIERQEVRGLPMPPITLGAWKVEPIYAIGDCDGSGYRIIDPRGVERARFRNADVMGEHYALLTEYCDRLKQRAKELEEQNVELEELFDLQRTRMDEATKLWQEATGRHTTFPDLGDLLAWLMSRAEEATRVACERAGADPGLRDLLLYEFGTTDTELLRDVIADMRARLK